MVKKNNLEDMMDILSSELSRDHSPEQIKNLKRVAEGYSICQEKYKKLTGKYYEPKDF
jgi:hypothetical protein